jgi:hypothetical protein
MEWHMTSTPAQTEVGIVKKRGKRRQNNLTQLVLVKPCSIKVFLLSLSISQEVVILGYGKQMW